MEVTMSTTREIERRTMALPVELRNTNGSNTIGGYAIVWDVMSRPLDGFVEIVSRSFTKRSASDGWPGLVCRWDHDTRPEYLLGSTRSGTLRPTPDNHGLFYECDLIEQRSDLAAMVARGDVAGSSFAFHCYQDEWGMHPDGYPVRTLVSGKIIDLSPTNNPAYEASSVSMRSLAEWVQCDVTQVRKYAETGDLAAFFKRTDLPSGKVTRPALTGPQARALVKQLKIPTTKQRQVELMAMASVVPQSNTNARRRAELTRMRYSPEPRTVAQARVELTDMMALPEYQTAASQGLHE
jgi:HK97 family phage prohead protease